MRPVRLYFHGLPGSEAELTSFGPSIAAQSQYLHVVARSNQLAEGLAEGYFARLADQIAAQFPDGTLRLVGFSLGAAAALRVAPHLAARVEQIDLVSPAAPLVLGDFLRDMAGAPVFRAALAGRVPLRILTMLQAQAARFACAQMAATLMAKPRGADRGLAADPQFMAGLSQSLRCNLLERRNAYVLEVLEYVDDWSADLAMVSQPVAIWQGGEDDWTPPAMAEALAACLPNTSRLFMQPGLSHFSTLRAYLSGVESA